MDHIPITVVFLTILCASVLTVTSGRKYEEFNLTTIEIIEKYDYPSESHNIETEDGYYLMLVRIPHGRKKAATRGVPVILVHGMIASTDEFVLLESDSMAFVIADAGFDVWMPNLRGNSYSRDHTRFTIDDKEFWDFSWHENGIYDLPATVDYVCNYTKSGAVLFIGYSMGSTAFLVMASERPEYQSKIRASILMGPVAFMKHVKSVFKILAPISGGLQMSAKTFINGEFSVQSAGYQRLITTFCTAHLSQKHLCRDLIFIMAGSDPSQFDLRLLPNILSHFPSSTSTKTFAHYGQLVTSGKFRKYDYGLIKNLKTHYNRTSPPDYDLESITIPTSLFVAPNDIFVTEKDLEYLRTQLKCLESVYSIEFDKFTHLDFVFAKNAKKLVYIPLVEKLVQLMNLKSDS